MAKYIRYIHHINTNNMTAVEWLISQYIKDGLFKKGVYEQALEMEKQQIIDARINGDEECSLVGSKRREYAEQYYNETYK